MPGDPLKHVVTGEKFQPQARTWNTFVDTSKWVQSRQIAIDRGLIRDSETPGIILVKNESGSTVERFHALGLDEPIILPSANENEFKNRVAFRGVTPTASIKRWALILEPCPHGKIRRAAVSGVFPATINVNDANDDFADIEVGETLLQSGGDGYAQILWKDSGTGEKWAVVMLGGGVNQIFLAKCSSSVSKGSSGTFTIYGTGSDSTKGSETATSKTVTALVRVGDYTANKWAYLIRFGNGYEAFQTECAT